MIWARLDIDLFWLVLGSEFSVKIPPTRLENSVTVTVALDFGCCSKRFTNDNKSSKIWEMHAVTLSALVYKYLRFLTWRLIQRLRFGSCEAGMIESAWLWHSIPCFLCSHVFYLRCHGRLLIPVRCPLNKGSQWDTNNGSAGFVVANTVSITGILRWTQE